MTVLMTIANIEADAAPNVDGGRTTCARRVRAHERRRAK